MKRILLVTVLLCMSSMVMAQVKHRTHTLLRPHFPDLLNARVMSATNQKQQQKPELTEEQRRQKYISEKYRGCNKGTCEIEGNDCGKVADLVHAMFRNHAIDAEIKVVGDKKLKITIKIEEPYREQLAAMNLNIEYFDRIRDGGSMYVRFSDGTIVYWPNGIGDAYAGEFLEFRSSSPMGPIHFVYSVGEHPAELVVIPQQEQP